MKKSNSSDGILVFDRYYTKKPVAALLVLQRVLFCACLSASAMLFVFSQFNFPISLAFVGIFTALTSAALMVMLTFLGRRYTVPALFLIGGFIIYFNFEQFWLRFSFFIDEAMLLVDGRFLFPKGYLLHDISELTELDPLYTEGVLMGSALLCALYSLLCAFSMKRRIRTIPALLGFILLCVPKLLGETFEFDLWFLPAALLFAASAAIEINYRNGLAVTKSGTSAYRAQVRDEERNFIRTTKKASLIKRVTMRISYYSKYTTSGVACVVIFALAFCIAASVFPKGSSIDYVELYKTVFVSEGGNEGIDSAPDKETVSDYFSSPNDANSDLNITTPGKGDQSIIKVTFTGDNDIYLRGDIGIDFTGTSWTTPVKETDAWENSGVAETYRPAEMLVLRALLSALDVKDINGTAESDITIEYLFETDVVFLPAYTADFSYYDNEAFDVYGDFSVRVSKAADNYINSVHCTAVSHDFTGLNENVETLPIDIVEAILKYYSDNNITVDDLYSTVVTDAELSTSNDTFSNYSDYVKSAYLNVPEYLDYQLREFMDEQNIQGLIQYKGSNRSLYYYSAAAAISDFLSKNYIYSLSGANQGEEALMQFLTITKSGHCSLYATAMTLMLRELDIPARYCTGFSIYPSTINGNTVELKERNLHAWVEVYIDELGWVTFDPTSSAVSGNVIYSESEDSVTPPPDQETKENEPLPDTNEEHTSKPDNAAPDKDDNAGDTAQNDGAIQIPTHVIIIIAVSLAITALVGFIVYKYRSAKKRAEETLDSLASIDVSVIYRCLVDILYLFRLIPQKGQLPSDYYVACDRVFECGIAEYSSKLEKAAFGADKISDEEKTVISETLDRVYNSAIRKSYPLRRYNIRKMIGNLKTAK